MDWEYFFSTLLGHDVLIAPIVNQHETALPPSSPVRDVYLPAGSDWYAFTDNSTPLGPPVKGGTLVQNWYGPVNNSLPLYLMPIYYSSGGRLAHARVGAVRGTTGAESHNL